MASAHGGRVSSHPILEIPQRTKISFLRQSCKRCDDFTAEYADISVGGIGCPNGYSTIVARTEKGLQLLKDAQQADYLETQELTPDSKGYLKVVNMAQTKRLRKNITPHSSA